MLMATESHAEQHLLAPLRRRPRPLRVRAVRPRMFPLVTRAADRRSRGCTSEGTPGPPQTANRILVASRCDVSHDLGGAVWACVPRRGGLSRPHLMGLQGVHVLTVRIR